MQTPTIEDRVGVKNQPQPIDWISVEGFRSIGPVQRVELNGLNVVIGANGSGKSSFLRAFDMLRHVGESDHRFHNYVLEAGGAESILHFGSGATTRMNFCISFEGQRKMYELALIPAEDVRLFPQSERLSCVNDRGEECRHEVSTGGFGMAVSQDNYRGENPEVLRYVRERLREWRIYHFHDTGKLSSPKSTADIHDTQYLHPQGKNLAAFLYMLRELYPAEYEAIRRNARDVISGFDDFVLEPDAEVPEKIRLRWRHRRSSDYLGASTLPGGGLRFVLLATLLMQPAKPMPSLVLLDEPEIGLHPAALWHLKHMLNDATYRAQVIIATQSSQLLDRLEPEDLLVVDQVDGGTTLTRLERSEQLDQMLEGYTLGQLWEQNRFGGVPRLQ